MDGERVHAAERIDDEAYLREAHDAPAEQIGRIAGSSAGRVAHHGAVDFELGHCELVLRHRRRLRHEGGARELFAASSSLDRPTRLGIAPCMRRSGSDGGGNLRRELAVVVSRRFSPIGGSQVDQIAIEQRGEHQMSQRSDQQCDGEDVDYERCHRQRTAWQETIPGRVDEDSQHAGCSIAISAVAERPAGPGR